MLFFHVVRLGQVDHGEHGEDEGLESDDQHMEYRPGPLQYSAEDSDGPARVHQGDQDEDHLARVEVAEEPQAQRQGLREQGDRFQDEVDGGEHLGERVEGELAEEAAGALLPDAVEEDQGEDGERHAHGDVRVRRRDDLHVGHAEGVGEFRDPVHRDQVHQVHQEDPDEDRERERRDDVVLVAEDGSAGVVDELDEHLHGVLQGAGYAGRRASRGDAEDEAEDDAEADRPAHGIDVDRQEAHRRAVRAGGELPRAVRALTVGEVGQVVLDVFG